MRRRLAPGEKPLFWIGSSKRDLRAMPDPAYFAQGRPPIHAKTVHGFAPCRSSAHEAGRYQISVRDDDSSTAYSDISSLLGQRRGADRLRGLGTQGFELSQRVAVIPRGMAPDIGEKGGDWVQWFELIDPLHLLCGSFPESRHDGAAVER
jgi:hypothetical protein